VQAVLVAQMVIIKLVDLVMIHTLDHHQHQKESLRLVVVMEDKINLLVDLVVLVVVPVVLVVQHMLVVQQCRYLHLHLGLVLPYKVMLVDPIDQLEVLHTLVVAVVEPVQSVKLVAPMLVLEDLVFRLLLPVLLLLVVQVR
tara:strand:+ start:181 stop:603 length:423 start_codon:yes stop_codon:yes gene_type:complete